MLNDLIYRLRALVRRTEMEHELDDEVRFHLEHQIAKYQADGMSRKEAERHARMAFGGIDQIKEASRDSRGLSLLDGLGSDITFSIRLLKRNRMYAGACILTLALGIGATTAVFSVIDATLLRPLPYRDPSRLTGLNVSFTSGSTDTTFQVSASQIELIRWRAANSFEAIEALEPRLIAVTGSGDPEVVPAAAVTSGLFAMLGVNPQAGRVFTDGEERSDAARVVISDTLMRCRFGSPSSAIGRNLVLDGRSYEVVGVMPLGFRALVDSSEVWVPLRAQVDPARANMRVMTVVGRLRAAVTPAQAQQELSAISAGLAVEFPASNSHAKPLVNELKEQLVGTQRPALLTLGAAVLVLLILACVNVLNLTVGHLAVRRTELAVRAVVGGGAWRLARLQLVETGVIAVVAGGLGVALMNWLMRALLVLHERQGRVPLDAHLDWKVAAFGALLTFGTAVVSGVIPALRAHRASLDGGMASISSGRVRGGLWERRIRAALVVAQVALAVTLLCGAGVFAVSLKRLLATNPGFTTEQVWSAQLRLAPLRYPDPPARARFVKQMLERVTAIPGVAATGTTQTTFLPNESMQTLVWIEGRTIDAEHTENAHIRHVTPGYFGVLRVPVIEGRAIDDRDQIGTTPVCMVSARFAKQFWPKESAIGHRIRRNNAGAPWMTIVGVAADIMDNGLGIHPGATLYVAYLQQNTVTVRVSLVVRAASGAAGVAREIERAVWAIDPAQPVDGPVLLVGVLAQSAGDQQFRTVLLGAFAVLGLVLALIGVYGVTAAAIASRKWEVGIRMALGATPTSVVSAMLAESGQWVMTGAVLGVALFLAFGRLVASLLYNTSFGEPLVLVAAVLPLLLVALFVTYFQARQLADVPPAAALRGDV